MCHIYFNLVESSICTKIDTYYPNPPHYSIDVTHELHTLTLAFTTVNAKLISRSILESEILLLFSRQHCLLSRNPEKRHNIINNS